MLHARTTALLLLAALAGCGPDGLPSTGESGGTGQPPSDHSFSVDPANPGALTSVAGTVYGTTAGQPKLAGIVVRVLFMPPGGDTLNSITGSVVTDANGEFTVQSVPAGSLFLIANQSATAGSPGANWSSAISGTLNSSGTSSVITVSLGLNPTGGVPPDTQPTPPVVQGGDSTLSLMPGNPGALTAVAGDVHGLAAGDPALAGIVVRVSIALSIGDTAVSLSGTVRTNAAGRFTITAIPAGVLTLTANVDPAPGSAGAPWGATQPETFTSTGAAAIIPAHLVLSAAAGSASFEGLRLLTADSIPGDSVPTDTLPTHGRGHGHGRPPHDSLPNH